MRLAGYNTNRTGIEPMNGMGIYSAADELAAQWIVAQRMAVPATAAAEWDLRQFAANAVSFLWGIREFVAATRSALWDTRQFAAETVGLVWDVGQGVVAYLSAKWRVPFSPHSGSSLSRSGASSALVRHTATSSISEH